MMNRIINAYIPVGMYRSVEWENVINALHPVRDASLTGCKGGVLWHFLPSDVFLTEYGCKRTSHHNHGNHKNLMKIKVQTIATNKK
jgi:hypothetical protein